MKNEKIEFGIDTGTTTPFARSKTSAPVVPPPGSAAPFAPPIVGATGMKKILSTPLGKLNAVPVAVFKGTSAGDDGWLRSRK